MTKKFLKFVSFVTALCVLMGVMPLVVYAEDGEIYHSEEISIIQFSPETQLPIEVGASVNKFYSNSTNVDATKYFYNQLTANQKKIYEQIWAAGPVQSIPITMNEISIKGTGSLSSTAKSNAETNAMQDIVMAITALNEDNPLFFWVNSFGISYGGTSKRVSGTYTYTITALTIVISINTTHYADFNDVATKQTAIIEAANKIKVNGISRHEKLKSIHDYLAKNIVYDNTSAEPNIFDSYGALVNGVCVCEGYAEAFKLLCDREGIPCLTVMGTGDGGAHKWNMVQMEDGEWYLLDSTWDDQSSNIYYSYFLIGSDTKAPFFSNSTVADSTIHIPNGKLFPSASTALSYPTLSNDTYGVGILRYGAKDVHFDTTRNVIMVGKDVTNYYSFITNNATSGFTRTQNGSGTTTSTLTVSDGTTTKTYLVAMRGDVDASNVVDATDYTVMTQICAATYEVEENSAKFYAGDINQDGAVDGFDAIAHELYTNGELVFE